jgi:hypothetical protein
LKGRWSQEWATLYNNDRTHSKTNIKYNSTERWAKEIIEKTWDYIYANWKERNEREHENLTNPVGRQKEKLIEMIQGESQLSNYVLYNQEEVENETLEIMPVENLKMLLNNIKNAKTRRRKNRLNLSNK